MGAAGRMYRPGGGIVDVGSGKKGSRFPVRVVPVGSGVLAGLHVLPQLDAGENEVGFTEILHIHVFVLAVEVIVQAAAWVAAYLHLVECRLADRLPGIGARQGDGG